MRRILLKLSGEAFSGSGQALSAPACQRIARALQRAVQAGVEVAVVVGGGNLVRARDRPRLERVAADRMGMLATVINALALQAVLEAQGQPAPVQSAVPVAFAEPLDARKAREALAAKQVVLFAGGTGNPFVTTDTAAAIRAAEVGAELLLKATNVPGVYTADPKHHPTAKLLKRVSYERAIEERLEVMDLAALALCRELKIPIRVFDARRPGALRRALTGAALGTLIG